MKKAFNFRSVIICALVLILCLSAFVACDKDKGPQEPDLSGLENVKKLIHNMYKDKDGATATADFEVLNKYGDYTVEWTVTVTEGDQNGVKIVEGSKENYVKVQVDTKAAADIKFVLKATVKDNQGHSLAVGDGYNMTVPKNELRDAVAGVEGVEGVAYKIVMTQSNVGKTLYLNGKMVATYYFGGTEDVTAAVDVYVEVVSATEGTYRIYTTIDGAKKYIEIVPSGSHINVKYNDEISGNPWTWNDTLKTYQTHVEGAQGKTDGNYALGTYGDKTTFSAQLVTNKDSFFAQLYGQPAPEKTDEQKVALAKAKLTLNETEHANNFELPLTGEYNTTISWAVKGESNVLAINGKDAIVTKPETASEKVTIVATIKSGDKTDTKEFEITILGETPKYTVTWTDAKLTATYGENQALLSTEKVEKGTEVTFTVDVPAGQVVTSVKANDKTIADAAYKNTFKVTVTENTTITVTYTAYTVSTVADVINGTDTTTLYQITGYVVAFGADAGKSGVYAIADANGNVAMSMVNATLAVGDYVTVYTKKSVDKYDFPTLGVQYVQKLEGGTYVEPAATTIDVNDVVYTDMYLLKYYKAINGTINVDTNGYVNLVAGNGQKLSLYSGAAMKAELAKLVGKEVQVYGVSRSVNAKTGYWGVQVARYTVVNDAMRVERAKAALTIDVTSTGANFTLPTTGINGTTITWTSSNTAVVSIEGGNATVNNTTITEDTVVTLTATIKLNATTDTKTFDVTITKEIKNYTVTIVAPTEGGTLVVKANTEDVVSGASLTENTVLTFVAKPAKGYKLVAIKVNGVAVSETTLALTENVEVTAEFKLLPTSKVEGAEIKSFAELKALLDGGDTTNMYYTMGYIKTVSNATYGNATIEDFDGNTFEIYGMYDFTGATIYDKLATKPVAGDFVVLYGTLKNFNGTKEMIDARIAQLNDTVYAPTFAARVEEAKNALTLEAEYGKNFDLVATGLNGTTITWISSNTGLVSIAETAVDGKYLATVTVPDADTSVTLMAIITLGTAQDTKEITVTIKANTKVALTYGTSENGTFEVKANGAVVESGAQLDAFTTVTVTVTPVEGYQLASYTLGEGEAVTTVAGQTSFTFDITATTNLVVTFEVKPAEPVVKTLNFTSTDTNTLKSDTQQVWEENGITLTNDKDKSSSNVFVAAPVRLYQSSKVTISCTGITKIVFVTDNQTKYVTALKDSISSLGTVTVNGFEVTLELSSAKDSIEFSCTKQVRLKTLSVYTMA